MSITLTETAAKHVASFLTKRGKGVALRLGVRTTGCSGLAYKLEYADVIHPEDHRFDSRGITVVVDPKSLPYLDGMELDFFDDDVSPEDHQGTTTVAPNQFVELARRERRERRSARRGAPGD